MYSARIYENEKEVGEAFSSALKSGVVKREDLFVVSKLCNDHHDPKIVVEKCKTGLKDLQLDYLDCYLMHWPLSFEYGAKMIPAEESKK